MKIQIARYRMTSVGSPNIPMKFPAECCHISLNWVSLYLYKSQNEFNEILRIRVKILNPQSQRQTAKFDWRYYKITEKMFLEKSL